IRLLVLSNLIPGNLISWETKRDTGGNNFQEKLKEMQRFFHFPVTGKLNSKTLKMMKKPWCGLSDSEKYGLHPKWKISSKTFRILKYTSRLQVKLVDQVIKKTFKIWSDAISLKFVRDSWMELIKLVFLFPDHNDSSSFDGPGGFLAHAFQPALGNGGAIHFDEDESWSLGHSSYNLLFVAIGHELGLFHTSDPESVMFPFYSESTMNELILSHDDVEKIQSLYGKVISFQD
uniref:Peptidase metallopeptidase domain-containing protein n=1 Tax=Callorhinchus milii TaxID=7868 RepID=A0A4W3J746_CALMI